MEFDKKIAMSHIDMHLSTLCNDDNAIFYFRAIKGKRVKQLSNLEKGWREKLLLLTEQEYQLFVTINETDGKGLKKENVTKVNALFLDLDSGNDDNLAVIEQLPLLPSLVINTSKGKFHCYWIVVDCPLDQFTALQKALAKKFNGDISVSDLSRIMRLAGSYNRKAEPYLATVISNHSDAYTIDEITKAFSFGSFVSANMEGFHKNNVDTYIDKASRIAELISNIGNGIDLHHSLLSLAAFRAYEGVQYDKLSSELQSLMHESKSVRDARYKERYSDIGNIVKYAIESVKSGRLSASNQSVNEYWPEPTPLINELKPVTQLDVGLLPKVMQELVIDSAERMQCPPDFLAAGLIVTSSSIVARNVVIQPKLEDTGWIEHPNLWGAIIGKPSLLKSPTLSIAMSALEKLERQARDVHDEELKEFNVECELADLNEQNNKKKVKELLKKGNVSEAKAILLADKVDDDKEPTQARYFLNDGTFEKNADLQCTNTKGLLVFRDELTGWFNNLNKPDKTNDRSFYLESWNGNKPYTIDRIGRGTTHIPTNRLCILGGIQPDMFSKVVFDGSSGSQGGDGLLQRFQIAVYPDVIGKVSFVDRAPNKVAIKQFEDRLLSLAQWSDEAAEQLVLRFSNPAYQLYKKWFTDNESLLRDDSLSPSLESHYAKYRGLVPSIAGIFHVLNNDGFAANVLIDEEAALSAIAYVEYLRTHAERIYALPEQLVLKGAKSLLAKFDKLGNEFTLRDAKRKKWAGLSDGDVVEASLAVLEEHGYCQQLEISSGTGRPSIYFVKHPKYQLPKLTKPLSNSSAATKREESSCEN